MLEVASGTAGLPGLIGLAGLPFLGIRISR